MLNIAKALGAVIIAAAATCSHAAVVGFDDITDNGTQFTFYTEDGFMVFPAGGAGWTNNTVYGAPAPFVHFTRRRTDTELWAGMFVRAEDGLAFTFESIDLYSSVTPIPYRFIGYKDATLVFDVYGTLPNTFGLFRTADNTSVSDLIDMLYIELVNPYVACCGNPVGMDNIVVAMASAVPEPGSLALLLMAISSLAAVVSISKRPGAPR